jgi:hypothetical protein
MRKIQEQKMQHYERNGILKRKNGDYEACLKNSVRIFVEKVYKMGCLEGSGVPVLYIGRTVLVGLLLILQSITTSDSLLDVTKSSFFSSRFAFEATKHTPM